MDKMADKLLPVYSFSKHEIFLIQALLTSKPFLFSGHKNFRKCKIWKTGKTHGKFSLGCFNIKVLIFDIFFYKNLTGEGRGYSVMVKCLPRSISRCP